MNHSEFSPGEVVRFEMIFQLFSDQDPNYRHIHTLKGIGQHTLGPWTQYEPVYCVPATEANPCTLTEDTIRSLNVRALRARGAGVLGFGSRVCSRSWFFLSRTRARSPRTPSAA